MGTSIPSTPLNDIANAGLSNVAGVASGAGILGALASGGTSLLFQAGLSVVFGLASSLFRRKPRPKRGRDLQRNLADPASYLPIVYGTHRVPGLRTFVWSTGEGGSDYRYLWVCCALCHGPIAGIDEIYLDGYLAVTAAGNAQFDADTRKDYSQYVSAWRGYGTDGQLMYHPRTNARTVTGNSRKNENERYVDFSAAHSYVVGDTLYISGISASGIVDHAYFVSEVVSSTRIAIGYVNGGSLASFTGLSGSCDYYNPDLPTELSAAWTSGMQGKGVAFVMLRLVYDEARFPNGIPEVEANVRGVAMKDPRSPVTGAISTSAVSASGVPRHASAGLITTGAAHGLLAGDTVVLSGHSVNEVNGTHRIFDVPSSTQFRIPIALSGAGTGGTWAKLAMLTTPALCIREFLTNRVYGPAADESTEIDDTAWNAEATYHETATGIPVANSPTFQNRKGVSQIVVSGGVAVATTTTIPSDGSTPATTTHQFTVGQTARISGFSTSASGALNGSFPITAVTTNTFSFATAVANGTYFCDTSTVRTPRTRDELSVTTYMGRVIVTTPGTLFACNGLADPSQSIQATLEELLSSCRGLLVYQSGKFRLVTPRATTPLSTFALTDDTIVGDVTVTCPGQDDAANVVVATFPNIASNFQQDTVSFPAAIDPNDLLAGDNNLWLRKEINLPFTTNRATAQQIAMVLRRESRARVLQCVATEAALLAQVGDVVPVTRDVYGWSAKPFRVLVMAARQDDTVELTLVEHDDTWYNLDPNDDVTYYNNTPPTSHYPAATRITLVDFRKLGLSAHGGSGSLASGLSLGYTILNSANANITVSAHTVNVPTGNQTYLAISYPSANVFVSGSAAPKRGSPWYVYMDDPNVDGSGSYAATQTPPDLAQSATRRYIGSVTIPAGNTGTDATAGVDGSTKRY